ncbi:SRPBCC domain-containing protein [Blastopirellula sp. J2-11]|uniref:SRPBCC family protein n=1 Tax=Blastopirellula sp. J2-11 TaxID=2943192 RepID=UPI0021C79230|nr:SRPBCC domain-containing protein [Blastopirellula sp. J2-11]UUO04915.1 SRPBCC domain-containing protein [Blastopirellula sp. J2-11]
MSEKNEPIVLTIRRAFPYSAELVFDAWLDPEVARQWLFATATGEMKTVEMNPVVGGEFLLAEQRGETLAEHFGEYLEIDRPRRLVFAFATIRNEEPTRVTVEIAPTDAGCILTLVHEMDPKWIEYKDRSEAGWTKLLENLEATLAAM